MTQKRLRDHDAFAHAMGERPYRTVQTVREIEHRQQLDGGLFRLYRRKALEASVSDEQFEGTRFKRRFRILRQDRHATGMYCGVERTSPQQVHGPSMESDEADEGHHPSRLAGAVASDESEDGPTDDRQGEAVAISDTRATWALRKFGQLCLHLYRHGKDKAKTSLC